MDGLDDGWVWGGGMEGGVRTICYNIIIETGKLKTITGGGVVICIEVRGDGIGIDVNSTRYLIGTEHCVRSSVVPPF